MKVAVEVGGGGGGSKSVTVGKVGVKIQVTKDLTCHHLPVWCVVS